MRSQAIKLYDDGVIEAEFMQLRPTLASQSSKPEKLDAAPLQFRMMREGICPSSARGQLSEEAILAIW
ncbi:MAG: hypothetical protein ACFB0E_22860 [Leptolyngbyaceae cyanobacterium]